MDRGGKAPRKRCCECRRRFVPHAAAVRQQKTCGEPCRASRRRRLRRRRRGLDIHEYRVDERERQRAWPPPAALVTTPSRHPSPRSARCTISSAPSANCSTAPLVPATSRNSVVPLAWAIRLCDPLLPTRRRRRRPIGRRDDRLCLTHRNSALKSRNDSGSFQESTDGSVLESAEAAVTHTSFLGSHRATTPVDDSRSSAAIAPKSR